MERYMDYARHLAAKYNNELEPFDDVMQVACVGLMNAVNRFDYDSGRAFPAFAKPTIEGEIKRYFRDRIWIVRVPRGLQEDIALVDEITQDLTAELHRDPTPEEVDQRARVEPGTAEAASVAKRTRLPLSLDRSVMDDDSSDSEWFGVEDRNFQTWEEAEQIRMAMDGLDDTERLVMRLRFVEDMTQSEIADRIGCSQMHISRVLKKCTETLLDRM